MFEASYYFSNENILHYTIRVIMAGETYRLGSTWTAGSFLSYVLNNIDCSLSNLFLNSYDESEKKCKEMYVQNKAMLETQLLNKNVFDKESYETHTEMYKNMITHCLKEVREYSKKQEAVFDNKHQLDELLTVEQKGFLQKMTDMILNDTNYQGDSPYSMGNRLLAFTRSHKSEWSKYKYINARMSFEIDSFADLSVVGEEWANVDLYLSTEDSFDNMLELTGKDNSLMIGILNVTTVYSYFEFIMCLIKHMTDNNLRLKICKNCGRYFYPENRTDTIYCDSISPQDITKSCKEYGKYISYQNRVKENAAMLLHKQLYNTFRNQYNRCKTDNNKTTLDEFVKKSGRLKSEVKLGLKTEREYMEWLLNIKETKQLEKGGGSDV